jgi:uncharacterized DUF497 family protein
VDRITWDPEKDRLNRAKHGISFAEAPLAVIDGSIRIISARRATKRERHAYKDD